MKPRQIRYLLWTMSGLIAATTVTVGAFFLLAPIKSTDVVHLPQPTRQSEFVFRNAATMISAGQQRAIVERNWRRPLFDPPPAPTIRPVQPPPQPLTIRLAGTVVEAGHSEALIVNADGKTELKAIGEIASGGAELLEIGTDTVVVRYLEQRIELKVPKPIPGERR